MNITIYRFNDTTTLNLHFELQDPHAALPPEIGLVLTPVKVCGEAMAQAQRGLSAGQRTLRQNALQDHGWYAWGSGVAFEPAPPDSHG